MEGKEQKEEVEEQTQDTLLPSILFICVMTTLFFVCCFSVVAQVVGFSSAGVFILA